MEKDVASCQGAVRARYAPLRGAVVHGHLKQPAQETSQLEFLARYEMKTFEVLERHLHWARPK